MVERGEFIYDRSGVLGSRLRSILGMGLPRGGPALEMLIREALEPMDDIAVSGISIYTFNDGSGKVNDPRQILAEIKYSILFTLSQSLIASLPGENTTSVAIPV